MINKTFLLVRALPQIAKFKNNIKPLVTKVLYFFIIFNVLLSRGSFLFALENCVKQRMQNVSTAMVSKETEAPVANFVIRQEMDTTRSVLVSWENTGFSGTFVIRQGKGKTEGILFSKAATLDIKILNILSKENIRSEEDYALWLQKNLRYKNDEFKDTWSSPEEVLIKRCGDCEDFAFLNEAVLRVFGYQPKVFVLARLADNHAICVFKKDGRYLWFDNLRLKKTSISSFEEFSRYICANYHAFRLFEINFYAKDWNVLCGASK